MSTNRNPRFILRVFRRCPFRTACFLILAALPVATAAAQAPSASEAPDSARRPVGRLEITTFRHFLTAPYGSWRGVDVRARFEGKRVAPFFSGSTQSRKDGSQASFGVGSYLFYRGGTYAIAEVSAGAHGSAELYPRLRWDLTGLADVPGAPGLVLSAGLTGVRYVSASGADILSLGSVLYRGPAIGQAVIRLNRDRESGAGSYSALLEGQRGREGSSWVGASVGWGKEAYRVIALSPFDARFASVSGSAFYTRWTSKQQGFTARAEYERLLDTYTRLGLSGSLFFDF